MIDRNQAIALHEQLAARGITALQFSDGVAEWASAGLPVKPSASYQSLFPTPKS